MEAGEDRIDAQPAADTEISLLAEIALLRRVLQALEEQEDDEGRSLLARNGGRIATVTTALARLVYVHTTRAQSTNELEHVLQEAGRAALDELRLAEL